MDFGSYQRKFMCFVCGSLFDEYPEMKKHVMDEHEEGREWVRCPLTHCNCPVRCLRTHFKSHHPSVPIPKNCQLRASVWYDHRPGGVKKKKISFASGDFVSKKNGGQPVHYRSGWELQIYKLLEEMGEVEGYSVEPFKIRYYFNRKARTYIPDILVSFVNGSKELWEIKPRNQTSVPQVKAKKIAAEEYCIVRGMTYKIITESTIKQMEQDIKNRKLSD